MKRTAVQTKTSVAFPADFLNDLRARSSIEEVIGDYVTLKKQGKSLTGVCPFHTESTPSFHVSSTKKLFHCFGCKKGGDVFSFIQEREGLSFIEAVKQLADRYGLDIPESARNDEYEKIASLSDKLVRINKKALEHFQSQLEEVEAYLRDRGISEETEKLFQIGYAPNEWNNLKHKLKETYTDADIKDSGLFSENKDNTGYYDLFRDRLIIPIIDVRGRVVAFGGRIMTKGSPKYLNSPETPLYVKGNHLYGLCQTKEEIRKKGFAILTEGYFDLIGLYENGITNTVASLGTSLTENQAKLLRKYTDKVVICYDGDNAGLTAAERISEILVREGFTVKVMVLPDKKDPDDYIKEFGKLTFEKRRQSSDSWFKFRIQRIKARTNMTNPTEKAKAVEEILQVVGKCPTDLERYEFFRRQCGF
jgi:DNA primase